MSSHILILKTCDLRGGKTFEGRGANFMYF